MSTREQLIETWIIHSRITLFLLEQIPETALSETLAPRGWSVGRQFVHLHNARLRWLDGYPDLREPLQNLDRADSTDHELLHESLAASGSGITHMLERAVHAGRVKGFKPHVAAFVGYLIAHEAYHHGEIGVILGQSDYRLARDAAYAIWDWGKFVDEGG